MKHVYAEALRWMADGETIIARRNGGTEAIFPDEHSTPSIVSVIDGEEGWEFRLKPRTVIIGSREVEAPVLEPGALEIVWYWDTDYQAPDSTPASSHYALRLYEKGLSFATKDSCRAAHDAIHSLLRGEA